MQALVQLLEEELTGDRWRELMAAEQGHWQRAMAPRAEAYRRNQAQLFGGPARL